MASMSARRTRVAFVALGIVAVAVPTSCGDEPDAGAARPTSSAATATSTTATPATSAPATTTTTTTAPAAPAATVASTTTSTTLPVPIPVPADMYASEPVIELGRLTIPEIDVDMTMYEGIRMTTLDYGPGHWPGSAMPGQPGNVVVAGHRTTSHKVFRNIDQLEAGDEIVFHDSNGTHTYAVRHIEVVPPSALWIVTPTPTPTVTLFACHPPGSTRERIVVFADLVSA